MAERPPKTRRRRLRLRPRTPIWSVKRFIVVGLIVTALAAGLTFTLGQRSLLTNTEITLAVVAGALFVFLAVGLYRGVRVRKTEPGPTLSTVSLKDITESAPDMADLGSGLDLAGDEGGCLVALAGIAIGLVVAVVLVLGLWLLINVGLAVAFVLVLALSWIFSRALRQVFAHSRRCRGHLARSLATAGLFTLLYTGWLVAVVLIADYLLGRRG